MAVVHTHVYTVQAFPADIKHEFANYTRPVRSSVAVNNCKHRPHGPGSLMMSKHGYNSQTDGELAPPSSKSIRLDPDDAQSVSGTSTSCPS